MKNSFPELDSFRSRFFQSKHVLLLPRLEGATRLYRGHDPLDGDRLSYLGDGKTTVGLAFGCRAGPWDNVNLENLSHEMAHFVEIDELRSFRGGWGLKVPKIYVFGKAYDQPTTWQASARECRVIAYQANLMEAMRQPFDIADFTKALRWMGDFCFVPGKTDDRRIAFLVKKVLQHKALPKYSFGNFERLWFERVARVGRLCKRAEKKVHCEEVL